MRIHNDPIVEETAIEAIKWLQLGGGCDFLNNLTELYEEAEAYEQCLGVQLGIELFDSKEFGCRVSNVIIPEDD